MKMNNSGRELRHLRTERKEQDGYTQTFEVYGCADCSGCEHKARCLYKYDVEKDAKKNKVMKINEQWGGTEEKIPCQYPERTRILKRHVPFRQRDILETSRKTRTSGALTTARQIRYIKNSCYMPLAEI